MIKANEIRVGNWLNDPRQLTEFNKKYVNNPDNGYFIATARDIQYAEEFEPITLTEEILLNCGFEYYKESKSYELDCDFSVTIWGKYDSENNLHVSCDEIGIEIHYLHQLQNLYFALTGKELEIDL